MNLADQRSTWTLLTDLRLAIRTPRDNRSTFFDQAIEVRIAVLHALYNNRERLVEQHNKLNDARNEHIDRVIALDPKDARIPAEVKAVRKELRVLNQLKKQIDQEKEKDFYLKEELLKEVGFPDLGMLGWIGLI